MSYAPTTDPTFLSTIQNWFQTQSEILALVRIRCGAGAKEFELFTSFDMLSKRLGELSAGACVTVFKDPQLPLRGVVNDEFIAECLNTIPDGAEYLVVETARRVYGRYSFFHYGSRVSHPELRDDLEECRGAPVAAGIYPPWLNDSDSVISAVVPDADGIVRAGALLNGKSGGRTPERLALARRAARENDMDIYDG